jgi:hypothetical protein
LPGVFDDERRGPTGGLAARCAPEFVAAPFVERDDEIVVAFVIPINNHRIAVERRRCTLAEFVARLHIAEILFPFQVAFEVETVESP